MARQFFRIFYDEVDNQQFYQWTKGMLLVWISLKRYENKDHAAWPGYRRIQQFTGLSSASVRRAIQQLEAIGALQVSKAGRNNYYILGE
jgi:hypothetical protein